MVTKGIQCSGCRQEEYANLVQRTPRGKTVAWQARQIPAECSMGMPTDDAAGTVDRAAYDHETE